MGGVRWASVTHGPGRYFTREEAEALLPEVDRLLGRIQELVEKVTSEGGAPGPDDALVRRNGHVRRGPGTALAEQERARVAQQVAEHLRELEQMGVVTGDLREGLIDFPSLREGRVVYPCWRRGEPLHLRWWHETTTGFLGRQPLD